MAANVTKSDSTRYFVPPCERTQYYHWDILLHTKSKPESDKACRPNHQLTEDRTKEHEGTISKIPTVGNSTKSNDPLSLASILRRELVVGACRGREEKREKEIMWIIISIKKRGKTKLSCLGMDIWITKLRRKARKWLM